MTTIACQRLIDVDDLLDTSCGCDVDEVDDAELLGDVIDQASDLIALLTGNRIAGVCTRIVRPVRLCETDPVPSRFVSFDDTRRFGGIETIPLRGPNVDIVTIRIDGVALSSTEYGLLDNVYLFRRTGCWPSRNDLRLDDTEVGTWSITYRFGFPPDKLTRMACTELACELLKDAKGRPNALPRGVTSASIQGASVAMVRTRAEALRDGDEQLPILARFLSVYMDDIPGAGHAVWSPELDQGWNLVEVEGPSGS